jgi:nucleoside phosphorylase
VRGRTPEQVAELIVDRLQFVMGSVEPAALPSVGSLEASVAPMGRFPADEQGRPAVSLEGLHDSGRPQLHLRAGVDADRLVLAGSGASPPGLSISIQPQVDIGILTIRDDEFRAVLDVFPEIGRYRGPHREYALRRADAGGGDGYMAAVIRQSEQGNGEAQDAARDLIEDLAPRLLIVVGIAGGVPSDDLTLGDVIIATRIHDFTVEARNAKEPTEYAVSGGPITRDVAALVANLAAREAELGDWTAGLPEPPPVRWTKKQLYGPDSWQDKLRSALQRHHGKGKPPRRPRYIDGVIASSDRLVEDPGLLFPWITTARNILAVEMESAGVYRAARERCPMLAIRGISDIVGLCCHSPRTGDRGSHRGCASGPPRGADRSRLHSGNTGADLPETPEILGRV